MSIEESGVRFRWPVRIYWEDTDAGGVVYHASYLRFFERARTEWLRAQGINQSALRESERLLFVLSRIDMDYLRPARLDDLLEVELVLLELKRASFTVEQRLKRPADGVQICRGLARIVCLQDMVFRPEAIPKAIHQLIKGS
jgi:acyl-CoA thioester hydrolase